MRVSDAKVKEMAEAGTHLVYPTHMVILLANDALEHRAALAQRDERIKELEQTLASSQTASQHYYAKLIANKEAAEQRIAHLEAQVAAAKREGAAEELEKATADKLDWDDVPAAKLINRAAELRKEAAALRGEVKW